MTQDPIKRLDTLDLMRIYGAVQYEWDLDTDSIDWRGPLNKLLSPDSPFINGSSFQNCLDSNNFWKRAMAMCRRDLGVLNYEGSYHLMLPHYDRCAVEETGVIIQDKTGRSRHLKGSIRFLGAHEVGPLEPLNLSGYDPLTGYPEKPVLIENLASLLDQSAHTGGGGAYVAIAVDHLMPMIITHGVDQGRIAIKKVAERLRDIIRFDDILGRTSGCCFGLILKNCDRWGIIRAADRIMKGCEDLHLTVPGGSAHISISLGGIVYPGEKSDPLPIIRQAEKYLFEAQSIKGSAAAGTPYSARILPDYERPTNAPGNHHRRLGDLNQGSTDSAANLG